EGEGVERVGVGVGKGKVGGGGKDLVKGTGESSIDSKSERERERETQESKEREGEQRQAIIPEWKHRAIGNPKLGRGKKAGGGATQLLIGCLCSSHDMFPVQIGDRRRKTAETQQMQIRDPITYRILHESSTQQQRRSTPRRPLTDSLTDRRTDSQTSRVQARSRDTGLDPCTSGAPILRFDGSSAAARKERLSVAAAAATAADNGTVYTVEQIAIDGAVKPRMMESRPGNVLVLELQVICSSNERFCLWKQSPAKLKRQGNVTERPA
ncbi:uncharacterized protein BO96DRAFT_332071, partial [Aspergillus niger CBS 101883]|uniref:uncharacterized protein n=1 Tax=Aspergillus lacticoffeatus (strain CBS 101883) TaxID=1450533 RepID=UPI000D800C30